MIFRLLFCCMGLFLFQYQAIADQIDKQICLRGQIQRDDHACDQGFHLLLQKALQGSRPVNWVEALVDDVVLGLPAYLDGKLFVLQALLQVGNQQVDDRGDLAFRKGFVEDDFIEPV
ncbi:hypothetical protein SDC9_128684 [bioreactor metagenome]|uniref:Uncharacterized protein n=1 Tax=bioreactor metagenome TaxID=1076179 RepID=A0A645CXR6_9ZZZZ